MRAKGFSIDCVNQQQSESSDICKKCKLAFRDKPEKTAREYLGDEKYEIINKWVNVCYAAILCVNLDWNMAEFTPPPQ